ncbi:hypothetical protein Bca4012_008174 [Brassica carinata]
MGRHSCCYKQKLRKGLWSPEEDENLLNHINHHGHGCWSSVPKLAGLQRCGKSCRLRWINYGRESDDVVERPFPHIDHLHRLHMADSESPVVTELPSITASPDHRHGLDGIHDRVSLHGVFLGVLRPRSW